MLPWRNSPIICGGDWNPFKSDIGISTVRTNKHSMYCVKQLKKQVENTVLGKKEFDFAKHCCFASNGENQALLQNSGSFSGSFGAHRFLPHQAARFGRRLLVLQNQA